MDAANTPVPDAQNSAEFSDFIAELGVLQQAAQVLGVPVKDLIELRKSRTGLGNSRTGDHVSSNHQNAFPNPASLSLGLDEPWFGNQLMLESGVSSNEHLHPRNALSAATGVYDNFNFSNMATMDLAMLTTISPMHPATVTDMPPMHLTSQGIASIGGIKPSLLDQSAQGLFSDWLLYNVDRNPTNEVPDQGLAELGEGFNYRLGDGQVLEDLQFNDLDTGSSLLSAIPSQSDLIVLPENQSELGLSSITNTWSLPEPIQSSPDTLRDVSQSAADTPIMLLEKSCSMELESSNSSGSITKLRDIRPSPLSVSPVDVPGRSTTNQSSGATPTTMLHKMSVQKPKPRSRFERRDRLETSETRKNKACIRCHMQRTRCRLNPEDPFGDCRTCVQLRGPTLSHLPCLRYKISDSQLLDKGPHPRFSWTRRWTSMKIREIEEWNSPIIKTVTLTQDVGHASYSLQVREFVPLPGDSIARSWNTPSGVRSHPCAPYAIANMRGASKVFLDFVNTHMETFLDHYISKDDTLMSKTYQMALNHSRSSQIKDERVLLHSVLRLWVGSRMENKQERVSSEEVLGMTPQNWDPDAGNYGKYLVPPVMQAQVEILTTSLILLPMKKEVLKILQRLIEKNLVKSWFTIYLTLFILLHSCSMLTRAEAVRAAREGKIGAQSQFFNHQVVEEFHSGARTMLAYFHYCNKGSHPFAMDWNRATNISFAELSSEQVQFIKETAEQVKDKRSHFEHIRLNKLFGDDYYFISQLYELHWNPTHTV